MWCEKYAYLRNMYIYSWSKYKGHFSLRLYLFQIIIQNEYEGQHILSTDLYACFKDKNSDPVKIIWEACALRKLPPFSNFRACRIRHEMFRTQRLLVPVLKACLLLVMHRPEKCRMSWGRHNRTLARDIITVQVRNHNVAKTAALR